ncbi:sensor histidine kinase [Xylanibacter muris]|uniref:histidine kinase n=1 Tax=Xylanibacter muris TaxID=2736290 RepID=A0ABX2AP80_9BACT|nr:HAMP domain-containing sensor histidine kinase [Xylanibacter muris]NPD92357.1 sensor histidine kinase [Xylanibacter muris]
MVNGLKLSYHARLFLILLGLSWVLVLCFLAFQYDREKRFKVEMFNAQLQLYNNHILDAISAGDTITDILQKSVKPIGGLRVTVVDMEGNVVFDNSLDKLPTENHLSRSEVSEAVRKGSGYTIRRHSHSTNDTYFYSATKGDVGIVRSAVPYSVSLQDVLKADGSFLWFMLAVTLGISIVGYFATRRIGRTISRLNGFAERAERGERIYDNEPFPHDELGSISRHIIRLYARLQRTTAELDREHRIAMHEEQEKIRIKKQLTNNINHELKTPVASIKVCLETLIDHPELEEARRKDFLKRCHANTERLGRLLDDVSVITRMDDGTRLIEKTMLDVNGIVDDICDDIAGGLHNKNMTVRIMLPPGIMVKGNAMLISSIFRNLADNAIAYSGGTELVVSLVGETSLQYTFSVYDDGVGVPEEHLPRIFERFYRIDKGRSRLMGGTGLGLSIVKNAVIIHGGTISVENRKEGGLMFVFSIMKE